LSLKP